MNYCIAAFTIVILISVVQWLIDGRKNYTGPNIDEQTLIQSASAGDATGIDGDLGTTGKRGDGPGEGVAKE